MWHILTPCLEDTEFDHGGILCYAVPNFCSAWSRSTGWAGLASQESAWLKETMYLIVCRKQVCHHRAISRIHNKPPPHRESFKYCLFFSRGAVAWLGSNLPC